jgi:hypothetical protein
MQDMFKDAKVGDKVAIPYSGGEVKQAEITKLTPTQVVVGDMRFRRDSGNRIGDGKGYIEPWTAEHDEQAARYKAGRRLKSAAYHLDQSVREWGVQLPKDAKAANELSALIEKYLAEQTPKEQP